MKKAEAETFLQPLRDSLGDDWDVAVIHYGGYLVGPPKYDFDAVARKGSWRVCWYAGGYCYEARADCRGSRLWPRGRGETPREALDNAREAVVGVLIQGISEKQQLAELLGLDLGKGKLRL